MSPLRSRFRFFVQSYKDLAPTEPFLNSLLSRFGLLSPDNREINLGIKGDVAKFFNAWVTMALLWQNYRAAPG
jgi:hypothetical protein